MQFKRNQILRFAVAAAFAGGAVGANAALITPASATFAAVQLASELPIGGTLLVTDGAATLQAGALTTPFTPTAGQNLQISVTLNGGAKFGASPTMTCTAGGVTATAATLNLGGAGTNAAVFTINSTQIGTAISACWLTATTLTVTGAHTDVNLGITYTYGTLASSTDGGAYLQFQEGLTATKTAGGGDVIALVASGFVTVTGGTGPTTVSAGSISWTGDGVSNTATTTSLAELGSFMGLSSGSFTVAGSPLLATMTGSVASAGIWLVAAGGACAGARVASGVGGVTPITFTGLTSANLSGGMGVCLQFTGTTAISPGSITAQPSGNPIALFTLPSPSALTLMTVTRNGASTEVLNLPPSTNADSGFLRISNTSALTGAVSVTVYNETGTALATNCALGSLAANGTMVKTAAQLEAACTITPPAAGRYRIVVNGAFSTMRGQALARNANGTLVNMSADTSTNAN